MRPSSFEPEQERVDAMADFLQDEGGVEITATSKPDAMHLLKGKMKNHPSLYDFDNIQKTLWTLEMFSKTLDQLLDAFLAHSIVRDEEGQLQGYDTAKAFRRLVVYAQTICSCKELFCEDPELCPALVRTVHQSHKKTVTVLEKVCSNGGLVLLIAPLRFDMKQMSPAAMAGFSRYFFFLLHSWMFDPDCQEFGITAVTDYSGFDFSTFFRSRTGSFSEKVQRRRVAMLRMLTGGMPLRFKAFYAVNVPWYIEAPSRIALQLMPPALRQRIHFAGWGQVHEEVVGEAYLPSDHGGLSEAVLLDDFESPRFDMYIKDFEEGYSKCAVSSSHRKSYGDWIASFRLNEEGSAPSAPPIACLHPQEQDCRMAGHDQEEDVEESMLLYNAGGGRAEDEEDTVTVSAGHGTVQKSAFVTRWAYALYLFATVWMRSFYGDDPGPQQRGWFWGWRRSEKGSRDARVPPVGPQEDDSYNDPSPAAKAPDSPESPRYGDQELRQVLEAVQRSEALKQVQEQQESLLQGRTARLASQTEYNF